MAITKVKTLGITDANVTAAKLATDSVETAKITAANVTNAKLGQIYRLLNLQQELCLMQDSQLLYQQQVELILQL
jgi:hypothetical protein